ncbi:MAG: mandelate racemase/muconate lactonizing enzyme family protein [Planctomycetaceae bacterium]|nr:mandelate racemase/muconate lactonizing enzyme family protein [Planctomycetaceae bacterium]
MRIDHLETITLRFEYADGFRYAGGQCTARVTSIVLVHTDSGHVGIGAAYSHPGLVHLIVQEQLAPLLIGEDPTDVESLWQKMYRITRWYGRKGAAMSAIGAIDTACWDLRGKSRGQPVWALLGGQRPTCPAYASALLWKKPAALAEEAARLIERGFRRVKMRLGYGDDIDHAAVRAVREAIGPQCDMMCDGSMRYSLDDAESLAMFLVENNVFWFEEPFEPEDIDSYVALRSRVSVPLAAGENEFGLQGFRELIRAGALDIVQPDVSRCGGITEAKRVADLALTAGLRVAPHSWSDAVAIMANAHVVASLPHGITVEVDQTGNPFVLELLVEPLVVRDGLLSLSNAPGLGIELNPSALQRYRLDDPLHLPDGSYSDMIFGKSFL